MERLWAPWRMEYVAGAREGGDGTNCFICSAADGDAADTTVATDEHTVTVLNRFPYSGGHLMVCPRRHIPDVGAADDAEGLALFRGVRRAIAVLKGALGPDAFNVGINQGYAAGGSIESHLHIHVVPRWSGDVNFMPVVADTKVLPELLATTAARLRDAFETTEAS